MNIRPDKVDFYADKANSWQSVKNFVSKHTPKFISTFFQNINDKFYFGSNKEKKLHIKSIKLTKTIADIEKKIIGLENQIISYKGDQKGAKFHSLNIQLNRLNEEKISKTEELYSTNEKLITIKSFKLKALATKYQFVALGGKEVKLHTKDDNLTDGLYISHKSFVTALSSAGGKLFNKYDANGNVCLSGLAFDAEEYETNKDHIIHTLDSLYAIAGINSEGSFESSSGWAKIYLEEEGEKKVLLVKQEDLQAGLEKEEITYIQPEAFSRGNNGKFYLCSGNANIHFKDLEAEDSQRGTIIITNGSEGVYEARKQEIMYFLIRGMNVMTFNMRGFGQSTGAPSRAGVDADFDAAYKYLKEKHGVEDKDIILKPFCISGIAASHLAKKHPEMNVLLDRVPTNLVELAKYDVVNKLEENLNIEESNSDKILDKAKGKLKKVAVQAAEIFTKRVGKYVIPSHKVHKAVANSKGRVGVIFGMNDDVVDIQDLERIRKKRAANGLPLHEIYLNIDHPRAWWQSQPFKEPEEGTWNAYLKLPTEANTQIDRYLDRCKMLRPLF